MMLGPVKGCAVMISPWWHVHGSLHVCEGVETALALYGEGPQQVRTIPMDGSSRVRGTADMGDGFRRRPEILPVIERVNHLNIWAEHSKSRRRLEAANLPQRDGNRPASGHHPLSWNEGIDYGEGLNMRPVVPRPTRSSSDEVIKGGEVVRIIYPWRHRYGKWTQGHLTPGRGNRPERRRRAVAGDPDSWNPTS